MHRIPTLFQITKIPKRFKNFEYIIQRSDKSHPAFGYITQLFDVSRPDFINITQLFDTSCYKFKYITQRPMHLVPIHHLYWKKTHLSHSTFQYIIFVHIRHIYLDTSHTNDVSENKIFIIFLNNNFL